MQNYLKYLELYYDNYNIYNLIKKIDNNYELYFNKKEKLFIIINSAKNNQICLKTAKVCPDIINILQKTLVENSVKLFKEIDKNNEILEKKSIDNLKEKTIYNAIELANFSKRVNKLTQRDLNKIKEGKYA